MPHFHQEVTTEVIQKATVKSAVYGALAIFPRFSFTLTPSPASNVYRKNETSVREIYSAVYQGKYGWAG